MGLTRPGLDFSDGRGSWWFRKEPLIFILPGFPDFVYFLCVRNHNAPIAVFGLQGKKGRPNNGRKSWARNDISDVMGLVTITVSVFGCSRLFLPGGSLRSRKTVKGRVNAAGLPNMSRNAKAARIGQSGGALRGVSNLVGRIPQLWAQIRKCGISRVTHRKWGYRTGIAPRQ